MVKRIGRILGVLVVVLFAIGGVIYFLFPAMLVDFSRQQERNAAGLTEHSVTAAGHRMPSGHLCRRVAEPDTLNMADE